MQNTPRESVTVGIVAHNDSADIIYLLRSILKQKGDSFSIDEIIIITDGSTDNTAEKVQKYADKYLMVKHIKETQRRGNLFRLEQIFSLVKSTYTFIFDGDVILLKSDVLDTMVKALRSPDTGLVSANLEPMAVNGIKAIIIKAWYTFLRQIQSRTNNGNTVYNFQAKAFGIKTDLAKNIVFPKIVTSVSPYLFFSTKAHEAKFKFVSATHILFHTPQTFIEYVKQSKEAVADKNKLISLFGKEMNKEYRVAFLSQLPFVFISILKNPFNIIIMMLFGMVKFMPYKTDTMKSDNTWKVVPAIKRKVHSY